MSIYSKLCSDIVDFGEKNSNPRKDPVSKVTPHHMAAVSSAVNCAKAHRSSSGSSANYYIGNDGKICGGVSEDRRAWTSGTGNNQGTNDHMAITIEVSNSATGGQWPISDAAYKSLVALCADICTRYGFTPHFDGKPSGSITEHCMFQATACPGPTLKSYIETGKLEKDIKAAMGSAPAPAPTPSGQKSDEELIWDFLYAKIGNAYGVAGLMGNLYAESGLRANNLQNAFEKSLGMTDDQYTAAVDNGTYTKEQFVNDKAGYGLAQWTFWSRKEGLYNYKGGKSIANLDVQLGFLWFELSTSYKGTLQALQNAQSIYQASTAVLTQFERPADQSEAMKQTRAGYGQQFYDKYASGSPKPAPAVPYVARITGDVVNVREGQGTQYPIVRTVRRGEAYTIVEVSGNWGRLKSGVGWICLDYTQKV